MRLIVLLLMMAVLLMTAPGNLQPEIIGQTKNSNRKAVVVPTSKKINDPNELIKMAIANFIAGLEYYNKNFGRKEEKKETIYDYKKGGNPTTSIITWDTKQINGKMYQRVSGSGDSFKRQDDYVKIEFNYDFFGRFDFVALGTNAHDGRTILVYKFQPRLGVEKEAKYSKANSDKTANKIEGQIELWADDLTIKRMEFSLTEPVKYKALGIPAFELEKMSGYAEFTSENGRSKPKVFFAKYRYWVAMFKPNRDAEKTIDYFDFVPL